jgi:hypothetical protein
VKKPLYTIVNFPANVSKKGTLVMYQTGRDGAIPFPVRRVLTMSEMKKNDKRGGHAHHKTTQILIAVSGGCTVDLERGIEKKTVQLKSASDGLVLYPYVWHVMRDFKPGTTLLVLASTTYDEKDYIRDHAAYARILKKRI